MTEKQIGIPNSNLAEGLGSRLPIKALEKAYLVTDHFAEIGIKGQTLADLVSSLFPHEPGQIEMSPGEPQFVAMLNELVIGTVRSKMQQLSDPNLSYELKRVLQMSQNEQLSPRQILTVLNAYPILATQIYATAVSLYNHLPQNGIPPDENYVESMLQRP